MATVTIVQEVDGREVTEDILVPSSEFGAKLDTTGDGTPNKVKKPAVVENVEIENDSDTAKPTDQCGNTERISATNAGWTITISGLCTDVDREGNLTMQDIRDVVATSDTIPIRTDLIDGVFVVSNVVLTQVNEITSIITQDSRGKESAYEFQIQLGEEQSD